MSRAELKSWAGSLWEGLYRGLCETGAFMAMQNGLLPWPAQPHPADAPSQAHTGVTA